MAAIIDTFAYLSPTPAGILVLAVAKLYPLFRTRTPAQLSSVS
jgi:hypothetical protein